MKLFEQIRPELLEEIKILSEKHNMSLFDKIRKEDNMLNLKSLLTEAHFGFFFDSIGSCLKYNHKISKANDLTPDYIFSKNSQDIIAEVFRVNPAQTDMEIQEAEDKAIEEFKKSNPGVPVMGGYHSITWKPDKLNGENGAIAVKANKYGSLAEEKNKPLILCTYLDFISALDPLDLNHSLYGSPAEFGGEFAFEEFYPGSTFHDLSRGLFYKNEQMKKNISGVLLRKNDGSFVYYNNYSSTNRLNAQNMEFFLNVQHPYE
jgi:hypothetical protein